MADEEVAEYGDDKPELRARNARRPRPKLPSTDEHAAVPASPPPVATPLAGEPPADPWAALAERLGRSSDHPGAAVPAPGPATTVPAATAAPAPSSGAPTPPAEPTSASPPNPDPWAALAAGSVPERTPSPLDDLRADRILSTGPVPIVASTTTGPQPVTGPTTGPVPAVTSTGPVPVTTSGPSTGPVARTATGPVPVTPPPAPAPATVPAQTIVTSPPLGTPVLEPPAAADDGGKGPLAGIRRRPTDEVLPTRMVSRGDSAIASRDGDPFQPPSVASIMAQHQKPPKDWRYFVGGLGRVLIALGLLV
ncbi:MAG TPA: hypothetical protein VF855_10420, partial [Acidimicrobiales bacterium]